MIPDYKDVQGRKNFGPKQALMTTPQPCVMIATWDKDHNPDVMMAAWAGQYDHNQIVVSMSKHKTTENLELTGAFTVSFADIHTVAESDYLGIVSGNKVPDKVAKVGFSITPSLSSPTAKWISPSSSPLCSMLPACATAL